MGLWSCPRLKFSLCGVRHDWETWTTTATAAKLSVGRVGIGLIFQYFLGMDDASCHFDSSMCVCERERERQRDWERQRLGGGERESLVKPNYKCSLLNNFWANLVIKPTSGAITVFRGNMRSIDCFKPGIFEFPATAKELARTSSPVTLSHLHPNYIGLTKRGRYFNKIRFLQEAG